MAIADVNDILFKLSGIAAEHFGVAGLQLRESTTAADVPGWDSIAHIQLMLRVEEEFGIRFKTVEIGGVQNVGELARRVMDHLRQ
ncbi:acyl carrier protein [Methylosinus sporium]|uniref:Acyl carrier protein n=1 Tax=Methylosinus sporium TaxID=428 RepID=A0A549SCY0_METSR|nr:MULTISPECIES: acyl carrier protein [Methylosinus]MBU3891027.1 acyl carrier protein [Methylosinus sp. KRF6]TRL23893.1 acyl carrier protein [Methylosinus sporium]